MAIITNGHLWKYSNFLENKYFTFDKNQILNSLSKKDMDDEIQRLSGSMAISGKADLIMQLKKERGKTSAELSVEGRDIEYQSLMIDFDKEKFKWNNQGDYKKEKYI